MNKKGITMNNNALIRALWGYYIAYCLLPIAYCLFIQERVHHLDLLRSQQSPLLAIGCAKSKSVMDMDKWFPLKSRKRQEATGNRQ